MQEENNDRLEEFFRKALRQEDRDRSHMEQDWKSLEAMLDDASAPRSFSLAPFLWIAIGFLAGALVTIYWLNLSSVRPIASTDVPELQAAEKVVPLKEGVHGERPAALHSDNDELSSAAQDDGTRRRTTRDHAKAERTQPNDVPASDQGAGLQSPVVSRTAGEDLEESHEAGMDTNTAAIEQENHTNTPITLPESAMATSTGQRDSRLSSAMVSDTVVVVLPDTSDALDVAEGNIETGEKEAGTRTFRVYTGVVYSPELSLTKSATLHTPGSAYGLIVGATIRRRFHVQAAFLRTSKKYAGKGEDYHPPEGYWAYKTNGVVPDRITGECAVTEVPVSLRYDFMLRERSLAFVTLGLSNYRMTSEAYYYQFNEENPGASREWTSDKPSAYGFRVGQLSIGYERSVGRNISVVLEPYLKVPFAEIGWSNVTLYSTGVYCSLRYHLAIDRGTNKN